MTPQYSHLLPPSWKSQLVAWLDEDTPSFDYGGFVVGEAQREAFLLGKGSKRAVLAGTPFIDEIFRHLDCIVEWHVAEGDEFEPIKHIATVRGKARYLLLGERVALNILARCSGIATASKRIKDLAQSYGFRGIIAGTRKTTPGFRLVEKYGMLVGGIDPHRFDLSSMIMLKDNHIWSAGRTSLTLLIFAIFSPYDDVGQDQSPPRSHAHAKLVAFRFSWMSKYATKRRLTKPSRLGLM